MKNNHATSATSTRKHKKGKGNSRRIENIRELEMVLYEFANSRDLGQYFKLDDDKRWGLTLDSITGASRELSEVAMRQMWERKIPIEAKIKAREEIQGAINELVFIKLKMWRRLALCRDAVHGKSKRAGI